MTENEIKELKRRVKENKVLAFNERNYINNALEEIQQYRAIGTIDEFKALKEKNDPKKATKIVKAMNAFTEWGKYECPCCKNYLGNLNEYSYPNYCYKCGTEIDWQ